MKSRQGDTERGSAMIMAIFVLVLLTSAGAALLFISDNELKMSRADVGAKQLFFMSEGGLEDARNTLFEINKVSTQKRSLDDELLGVSGGDAIDFDPLALEPVYDSSGALTGFTGYGNDQPLIAPKAFAGGWYVAFLQNDPSETAGGGGVTSTDDSNDRVLLTAMAVDPDHRVEVTRALVERIDTFAIPPATITVLGPNAVFDGGDSNSKEYIGDDHGAHCPPPYSTGGNVPVVGVIGSASEANAESTIESIRYGNYTSGTDSGLDTVTDLTTLGPVPELWTNCELLVELADIVRTSADLIGNASTPLSALGTPSDPKAVFIDGDYEISGNWTGAGLLFVTGDLTLDGQAGWEGPIFVVGKGDFLRSGAGNGTISGGVVVADVAGPDRVIFTADDCSGEDGVFNTSDDGIAESSYVVSGSGTSTTGYCSGYFTDWQSLRPFKLLSFQQD